MTGPSLLGTAARLRLALLHGSLRPGPGAARRRFGFGLGVGLGLALTLVGFFSLAGQRGHPQQARDLATVLFTGVLVGWVVLPVLTFGSDDLLDPARLALLPLSRRQLLTVMGVGALIGVAPLATALAALGLLPATGHGPVSLLVALLAVVLLLALCVATSRAVAAALSGLLRSRRGRDLGVALTALVALGFQGLNPLLQLAARRGVAGDGVLHPVARALRWTPTGLLAAAPGGPLPAALLDLAAVGALLGLVLLAWERSVRRSLERPDSTGARRRASTALAPRGIPRPAGRAGAIAAKDLRYLVREPRRLIATLTGIGVPVLAVVLGPVVLSGGRPSHALVFLGCGAALLSALGAANRFGMDGSATWLLMATATSPRDARRDLLGGDLAQAVVIMPVLVALTVVLALVTGARSYAPPALGLAIALFTIGSALSGLLAVVAPYAVPPSQNAFSSGNAGQGCATGALTLAALVATAVACLPLLALLLPALHHPAWGWALLVVGPAYGMGVGALLRAEAARRWAERAPEVLQLMVAARA